MAARAQFLSPEEPDLRCPRHGWRRRMSVEEGRAGRVCDRVSTRRRDAWPPRDVSLAAATGGDLAYASDSSLVCGGGCSLVRAAKAASHELQRRNGGEGESKKSTSPVQQVAAGNEWRTREGEREREGMQRERASRGRRRRRRGLSDCHEVRPGRISTAPSEDVH